MDLLNLDEKEIVSRLGGTILMKHQQEGWMVLRGSRGEGHSDGTFGGSQKDVEGVQDTCL